MTEQEVLADRFEASRAHLRGVAYRMLGSTSEAEDAVQEAWLRVSRAGADGVDNLSGWMTTIVARICLDMLRSRTSRREEPLGGEGTVTVTGDEVMDPEGEVLLADSMGIALLVVLETLTPAERVAFVLHDMFDLPFEQIAPIVSRTPAATRQLASRARRRVRGAEPAGGDTERKQEVVRAFLAASREGNFEALVALLDPEVVARADAAASRMGASGDVHGAADVARIFAGRARAAQVATIDGGPGLVWRRDGRPQMLFEFTISGGRIAAIEMVADPQRLATADVRVMRAATKRRP